MLGVFLRKKAPKTSPYGKITGSTPVFMLLSQLLMVTLQQPLLGRMGQQCRQKPPQSAGTMETLGPLLLSRAPVH